MSTHRKEIRLLMAEDDPDDQVLARKNLERFRLLNHLDIVEDGEELMAYLRRSGKYADVERPDVVIVDLNLPKKDGREAMQEISEDSDLRDIPIIVLTTAFTDQDVIHAYDVGVSSYLEKPLTFEKLVGVLGTMGKYGSQIVSLD